MVRYERRLQRFAAHSRLEVTACWHGFLAQVLPFWNHKPVTLVLDLMPYTSTARVVCLGLLLHSRVLPLGWRVMPQRERWEQGQ